MQSPPPPNLPQQRVLQVSYLDQRIIPQIVFQEKNLRVQYFLQILTATEQIFLEIVKVE